MSHELLHPGVQGAVPPMAGMLTLEATTDWMVPRAATSSPGCAGTCMVVAGTHGACHAGG